MNRIGLLINICLLLISCSQKGEDSTRKVIRYNASNGVTSLDPAFASNQDNIWAVTQLFDGLVALDSHLNPVPALAENWQIRDSGKTYVFHLKDKIFFHEHSVFNQNLRTVLASDFVYSFKRIMDGKTASPGAWIFGEKMAENPFEALDDRTLVIRLKAPYAPFLSILAMPYCSVVPREAVEKYGKDFGRNPVGTGPFQFYQWEDNVKLILHKNPNYYESTDAIPVPAADALSVSFIRSRESAFMEFLQGKLDFVGEIDPAFRSTMLTSDGELVEKYRNRFKLHHSTFLNTEYIAIRQNLPSGSPLSNLTYRKALNLAVDKDKMIRYLRSGIGKPAYGSFIPPALPGSAESQWKYDLSRAKELMQQVDKSIRNEEIVLTTTKDYEDLCIFLQNQWSKIGVKSRIEVVPSSHLKDAKRNGKLPMFRASWIADFADAENYLSCFISRNFTPDGPNYTYFSSEMYDSLYQVALSEPDPSRRNKIYMLLDQEIMKNGVIIPLYYDESIWLTQNLGQVFTSPLNIPEFKYMKVE